MEIEGFLQNYISKYNFFHNCSRNFFDSQQDLLLMSIFNFVLSSLGDQTEFFFVK